MASLVSTSARAVASHGQRQLRLLSTLPSTLWERESSSEHAFQEQHREVHHSSSLEETLENIFEMQRLGSENIREHKTWEGVVRSSLFAAEPALKEPEEALLDKSDSYSKRQCRVCGRKEDLCDLCSDGIVVSRFVPDKTKKSPSD